MSAILSVNDAKPISPGIAESNRAAAPGNSETQDRRNSPHTLGDPTPNWLMSSDLPQSPEVTGECASSLMFPTSSLRAPLQQIADKRLVVVMGVGRARR